MERHQIVAIEDNLNTNFCWCFFTFDIIWQNPSFKIIVLVIELHDFHFYVRKSKYTPFIW